MTYIFQEFEYYIDKQLHFCGILTIYSFYPKINNTDNINNNNNTIRILTNTYQIKEIKKIIQLF